ncbi:unnamed protein product [Cuscuta campestris]|uniref:FAD-binding domain-containing protein n=1 Tax=Cuscuta campestris TaxID=132261 RepID=A0A484KZM4_9ASTE|nr:unnamed protein product [Cuscuta campestris]
MSRNQLNQRAQACGCGSGNVFYILTASKSVSIMHIRCILDLLTCHKSTIKIRACYSFTIAVDQRDEHDPIKLKEFVLSKTRDVSKEVTDILERTPLGFISNARLKLRLPWNVLLGDIARGNVCVAGDALHPMTPDLGQGGCSALEDSVVLARCLGRTFSENQRDDNDGEVFTRIKESLEKYKKERRWRSFVLISTAYLMGFIQESNNKVISYLRDNFLVHYTLRIALSMADFDCGKLLLP